MKSAPNLSKICITKELMLRRLNCSTKEEVIANLTNLLDEKGFVQPGFFDAVLQRENKLPTGLETIPYGVAIPHTDPEYVNQSVIAVAILEEPIMFHNMAQPSQEIPIKVVFLLGIAEAKSQPTILRNLATFFQSPKQMESLINSESESDMAELLRTSLVQ